MMRKEPSETACLSEPGRVQARRQGKTAALRGAIGEEPGVGPR